ncbi:MAG: hypothetical protein QNJ11_15060 [Woeseiaceae bacterium]|nr:hypothetical protein [Woeseiaceae bacterium]
MELANRSDNEILAVVDPIMDNLMAASTSIDHARHVRDFTDRLKAIVTPANLDRICRSYQEKWGFLDRREFVAVFRRKNSIAVVWKQFCTKTDDEFVAELVLVEEGGRYLVDHVVFF